MKIIYIMKQDNFIRNNEKTTELQGNISSPVWQ